MEPPNLINVPPKAGNIAPTAISVLESTRWGRIRRRQKTQALYKAPPTRASVPKILKKGVSSLTFIGMALPDRPVSTLRSMLAVNTRTAAYSDMTSKTAMIICAPRRRISR